ncbi:MAG: hypothetical protein ACTSVU_03165 [Promethearchaeota archaeon]
MVKALLISDDTGFPYYSKHTEAFTGLESSLLSGLISSINLIGQKFTDENILSVKYGEHEPFSYMVIIKKKIHRETKTIYFCFFIFGEFDLQLLKSIATEVFIEIKAEFVKRVVELSHLRKKVNRIIKWEWTTHKT